MKTNERLRTVLLRAIHARPPRRKGEKSRRNKGKPFAPGPLKQEHEGEFVYTAVCSCILVNRGRRLAFTPAPMYIRDVG